MAVSPLDPQSVRLSIASDMANTLFLLFMVAFIQQMGRETGGETILPPNSGINSGLYCSCFKFYVATKQLISLISFGGGE